MKHIFLSYSHIDTDAMKRIADTLRAEGFTVWTDEKLSPGTRQWASEIEQAIANAWGVVVLLSPDAKTSDWVYDEIAYARTHNVNIFPILIRGEEKDSVPIELIRVQRIDIRTRFLVHMQSLVDTLQEHLTSLTVEEDANDSNESETVETAEAVGEIQELSDREQERIVFWTQIKERSKDKTALFAKVKPRPRHWLSTSAGRSRIFYSYLISKDWGAIEFYIDFDPNLDGARNKAMFDALYAEKEQIEAKFGDTLDWLRLDDKRASRILKYYHTGGLDSRESWPVLQEQMIEGMIRFDQIFKSRFMKMKF